MNHANTHILTLTDTPDVKVREAIRNKLFEFNLATGGDAGNRELAVFISESSEGPVVGGLLGLTSRGVLFIDTLYLPSVLRGIGLGSRVLALAEREALARGCRNAVLNTFSFQAPEFYSRHGWREFGRVDCEPTGSSRIFMTKTLRPAASD